MLLEVERTWTWTDVFVLRMPVGAGKSLVLDTIARWAGGGTICTPTNALVGQYRDTWPDLPTVPRGSGRGSAAALAALAAPVKVLNFYSYLAHRAYSPVVLFDEAHKLVGMLQEMEGVTLWQHLDPVPEWVQTGADLLAWAEGQPGKRLAKLAAKLRQRAEDYVLEAGVGEYRGHDREYLRLVPLTPRRNRPVLWPPSRVKKLVFASATFGAEDLHDLGLDGRRVRVLDCDSPIAAEDRRVVYAPVANMSAANQAANLPRLVDALRRVLARHPTGRGMVHTTYALARQLRAAFGDSEPRLRFHGPADRERVYNEWRRDPSPNAVLVASGSSEGLDLAGDLCRWQVVTKIAWPDRSDPAVLAKSQARPEWAAWAAALHVQQAVGRSSRGPGDVSVTYVLDSSFGFLYSRHKGHFTPSFIESLEGGSV